MDKVRQCPDTVVMSNNEASTLAPPADAIAAVVHPDPYPWYRSLRESRPLYWDAGLALWVASAADVVDAALNEATLRVRPPGEPVPRALVGTSAGEVFARLVRMTDGAFHAAHKPPVVAETAAHRLAEVARLSLEAADRLAGVMDANGFVVSLPVRVMAMLLRVPDSALDEVTSHVLAFVRGIQGGAGGAAVDAAAGAARQLTGILQALHPELDDVGIANRIGFMQQSVDATAGLLGNTVQLLQQRPTLAQAFMQSKQAARQIVAEVSRWNPPVQNTRRYASEDLALAGSTIRRGEGLLLVLASANRDESLNPEPEVFDMNRKHRLSLTFGAARHGCPGEQIAIEIVAAGAYSIWAAGRFDSYFGAVQNYLPLPNARVPVFAAP
jgi:cytochrome P450